MSAMTRPARESDLDALMAIESGVFAGDRISRRSFRTLLGKRSALILVAERLGRIAGYAALLFRARSRHARLYSIAAAPGETGIGRPLLVAAEDAARRRGADSIRLEVRADNRRAIALYERGGYRCSGRVPDYYEDGAAAIRFSKALATQAMILADARSLPGTASS